MDWFRYHHNTPYDIKLGMIAKKAGARRCEMTAIWDCLLDYASQHECRGCVQGIDVELIAYSQEIDRETVETVMKHLETKAVIVDGFLTAWETRQVGRERNETATSTERVRQYREKKKEEKQGKSIVKDGVANNETPCNASETPCNALDKIRLDKNIDSSLRSLSSVTASAETGNHENRIRASKLFDSDHEKHNQTPNLCSMASAESTRQSLENKPKTTDRGSMASDCQNQPSPCKPVTYPPDFERFWNAYPSDRRREKPNASKAWKLALKHAKPEEIIAGVQRYASSKEVLDGYSCYPAKWLKNQRWEDDYQPTTQGKPYVSGNHHQQRPNGNHQPYANKAQSFRDATNSVLADIEAGLL